MQSEVDIFFLNWLNFLFGSDVNFWDKPFDAVPGTEVFQCCVLCDN